MNFNTLTEEELQHHINEQELTVQAVEEKLTQNQKLYEKSLEKQCTETEYLRRFKREKSNRKKYSHKEAS